MAEASLYFSGEVTTSSWAQQQIDGWFGGGGEYKISPLVVSVFCQLAAENEEFSGVDLKDYALYRSKIKLNQI